MRLVRGDRLPAEARAEVLRAYIYRWTAENPDRERAWRGIKGQPTLPLQSDAAWLAEHAFHVTDSGRLARNRHRAEPAFMAD